MNSKEAFEKWFGWRHINQYTVAYEAWNAALEWAAKGQEPVALYKPEGKFNYESVYLKDDEVKPLACLPLYLHPAPTPAG